VITREAIVPALVAEWSAIDRLLAALAPPQWALPTALPGWSVHDTVAHLIGTESMLAGQAAPSSGTDLRRLPYVRNDVGAANEQWVQGLRGESADAMLGLFRAITAERRAALEAMPAAQFDAPSWTPAGPGTYGRFMRIRVFDCWMHEQDIRDGLNRPSSDAELSEPQARLAVDEIAATMGYVVGKLGKAPEGSRVAIELTGPLARTIRVAVDGRAQVVDDFAGSDATSTIHLDGLLFTRLAGGRTDDAACVELGGDSEVGSRIVERLNFVI
jgi:uncharacterized protein (TIGR03083 family)